MVSPHGRLALLALALLLLSVCSPISVSAQCGSTALCDAKRLPEPVKPADSDSIGGVLAILTGVLSVGGAFATGGLSIAADVGLGVLTGISGYTDAQGKDQDSGAWTQYQMQKDLIQTADYLVCKMESIVGDAIYSVTQKMDQASLDSFNQAILAITSLVKEKCPAMNCLNASSFSPSERNARTGNDCAQGTGYVDKVCKNTKWNPAKPVFCQFKTNELEGVCDPNGQCYNVYDYGDATATLKTILDMFTQKDNLDNFNKFSTWMDLKETVALAKGSLLKILVLQQLVMLDGSGGYNGDLKTFAKTMADNLQVRYDYNTDSKVLFTLIDSLSTGNTASPYTAPVTYPERSCYFKKEDEDAWFSYCEFWCSFSNANIELRQTTRRGCNAGDETTHVHKCPLPVNFGSNHKCGSYSMSEIAQGEATGPYTGYAYDNCLGYWKSDYYDPAVPRDNCDFSAKIRDTLTSETKLMKAAVTKELESVLAIITALRNIGTNGMPAAAFGYLRNTHYPLATCA